MPAIISSATLGEIVREVPAAAAVFEQLGLDFCCGGGKQLADACAEAGLDGPTLALTLEALKHSPQGRAGHDVADLTAGQLAAHVKREHHEPLRADLSKITELLATVVRVHGADDPSLARLETAFAPIRSELEAHMQAEEQILFPLAEAIDAGSRVEVQPAVIEALEHTHRETGEALQTLRETGRGYDLATAHCGTHRLLLQKLAAMEQDLHVHIHEENNVLFPALREEIAA